MCIHSTTVFKFPWSFFSTPICPSRSLAQSHSLRPVSQFGFHDHGPIHVNRTIFALHQLISHLCERLLRAYLQPWCELLNFNMICVLPCSHVRDVCACSSLLPLFSFVFPATAFLSPAPLVPLQKPQYFCDFLRCQLPSINYFLIWKMCNYVQPTYEDRNCI